jgi:hypothetical protein
MKSKWLLFSILISLVLLLAAARGEKEQVLKYHSGEDIEMYRLLQGELPLGDNSMFTGSGKCAGCHGFDNNGFASVTPEGQDVNVVDDWRATLMANSAKDPFWRAKVSHEVSVNPQHREILEDKCTSCHAPMGRFAAIHDGFPHYSMEMLMNDSLGLDGVSCNSCHQQDPANIGKFFSGELEFVMDTLYGPYGGDPNEPPLFSDPMQSFIGYYPMYGEHVSKSESCAGCHTLITNTVNLDGVATGNKFVEQATYHEWLNSTYSAEIGGIECQGCHMPRINEPVVISSNYAFLQGRQPFGLHYLVGGNTFMLELMRNRIDELDIAATEEHFDRVIDRTYDLLLNESVEFEITDLYVQDDTLMCELKITNRTGHKFPSGYPSRRAFVEFSVSDEDGEALFSSGKVRPDYEVEGQNEDYEPHYRIIDAEDEVQIYEMVLGDVNGHPTTVLERANSSLKDNRLAPLGFSTTHLSYDTTLIVGEALSDSDFNHENGVEGSGSDRILYKVALHGWEGNAIVNARFYYQSLPPKWMEEMFALSTPEIDSFKQMYEEEGPDPVLIADREESLLIVGEKPLDFASSVMVYPNPVIDSGRFTVRSRGEFLLTACDVYDSRGRRVVTWQGSARRELELALPEVQGTYFVDLRSAGGESAVLKVLRR